VQLNDFDYSLPENLIAKFPLATRSQSRLLTVNKNTQKIEHRRFESLPHLLRPGDLLVLNNTKVLPARLFGKVKNKETEVLLLEPIKDHSRWRCLVRPGKRVSEPAEVKFREGIQAKIIRTDEDFFQIEFDFPKAFEFYPWLHRVGHMPLPPYLKRDAGKEDAWTYQTVFAKKLGSVAAPTAGLHFTPELLEALKDNGIQIAEITLHVGYGTFAPIRTESLQNHKMHAESYEVSPEVFSKIQKAKEEKKRVIAVGTTTLRTLESIPTLGLSGRTQLFIQPGFCFRWTDGLITNFHLPKSSLYILVSAFLGTPLTQHCYQAAI